MKPARTVMVLVLPVFFISAVAGFGYVEKDSTARMEPGDSHVFKFYLYGDKGEIAELAGSESPANWSVFVTPEKLVFPPDEDYRFIQVSDGYRKIAPVKVTVVAPETVRNGSYTVSATFQQSRDSQGDIEVKQAQDFEFHVEVGNGSVEKTRNTTKTSAAETFPPVIPEREENPGSSPWTWAGLAAVLILSYLIWRVL